MRTIVRYVDGRAVWSDNIPASPAMHASRGGVLVVGEPASSRKARRQAAKRYRERQR